MNPFEFKPSTISSPENKNNETMLPTVPENEMTIDFVRSSGPGGQKVNKTSSKAQLRWNVNTSQAFTDEQKATICAFAGNRLNKEGEIVLATDNQRSQFQNRDAVIARLQALVVEALTPKKERKETRVSKSQKERRLEEKNRTSGKKNDRKIPKGDW